MSRTSINGDIAAAQPPSAFYRAVWRWHFYAGLLVLPFLILLATTGGLYLFKDEINGLVYRSYLHVAPSAVAPLAPSEIVAKAVGEVPGTPVRFVPAPTPESSVEVGVETADRGTLSVYVDPYTGKVLGSIADQSKLMWIIKKIHSLDYFGWIANRIIEVVAGWVLVLVATGLYLWWPRKRAVGVWAVRAGGPRRRAFWRDLHAVTGAYVGLVVFFLALTGLPWSGFWGNNVNRIINENGLGYPAEYWDEIPKSTVPMGAAMTQSSWTLENAPMPESTETGAAPIGIDRAVAVFEALGLPSGYVIDLPTDPEGVYSASAFPDAVATERVVHLDQYTGKPLFDAGFAELGAGAKAIEWGISVHQGQEYGRLNQFLMLAACFSIILMAIAAVVMWWKRRPAGSLGAPAAPAGYRVGPAILAIAVTVGILFPLVGASLLAMLVIDWLLPPALRRRLA